ncbi:thermopsin family protease [Stygiolobus caldivivus]|uniref:Thermopsin n=1 Tax=Stygiolobus caldivivus TaxID=2824673 RepID=A0A8D5ZHU7_9CREN|nr:thermopsin family protease [Stygiolobus caldivivus]BCU69031.1 thermopsin [Stygiolobus caldivivus]
MRALLVVFLLITVFITVPFAHLSSAQLVSTQPKPVGLVSYGICQDGKNITYNITTQQIIGYFKILSLKALNLTSTYPYYASLQLGGTVLTPHGIEWVQESLVFNTQNNTFFVASYNNGEQTVNSTVIYYTLPLAGYLIISLINNSPYTLVKFQYVIIQNGSRSLPPRVITPITAKIQGNAEFIVNYYLKGNVELVFGGYNSVTNFTSLYSQLALFYNESGLRPFPSLYNYGTNATGSSSDLFTILGSNDNIVVAVGSPNYGLITSDYQPPKVPLTFINQSIIVNGVGLYKNQLFYITSPYNVTFPTTLKVGENVFLYLEKVDVENEVIPNNVIFQVYNFTGYYDEKVIFSLLYPNFSIVGYNLSINSIVTLPNIINISNNERYVLTKPINISVNTSMPLLVNVSGLYIPQYLVEIEYPNGSVITNWFDKGSVVTLPKYIYVSPTERYTLVGQDYIYINSSNKVIAPYQTEYKVYLNYGSFSVTYWVKNGGTVSLNAFVPPFYEGKWEGTYNAPVGAKVVVNQYIQETLVLRPNIPLISVLVLILVLVFLGGLFWWRVKKVAKQ